MEFLSLQSVANLIAGSKKFSLIILPNLRLDWMALVTFSLEVLLNWKVLFMAGDLNREWSSGTGLAVIVKGFSLDMRESQ